MIVTDKDADDKKLPEELKRALKEVYEHFDKEDQFVRYRQLRLWKRMKYYWNGFTRIWWSEVAHDWRVFDINQVNSQNDASYYDKPINVFRAYLEIIIAALSASIPGIKCLPDNSDDPLDLLTAKGGDKIAELVYKHNDAALLWMHALFVYCTEGMLACYGYPKEDLSYGSFNVPETEEVDQTGQAPFCPKCGMQLDDQAIELHDDEVDEFQPGDDDADLHSLILNKENGQMYCSQCMADVDPELKEHKFVVTRLTGITKQAKTRQCLEVYGGLNVKIPNYARTQQECLYLIYKYEVHYAQAIECYPFLGDLYKEGGGTGGIFDPYERWARVSPQYFGEYPINIGTFSKAWLRPAAFNVVSNKETREKLKKRFPDGCKVVFWNDQYCESENEALDDCWTIAPNPLSDYVHYDPLGTLLTSVQEITNDLISLILQTIEHGVPQTFFDQTVLNAEQYRKTEVQPGQMFPVTPKSGKSLSDSFYEVKTATLSQEVQPFAEKLQELAQFTSGALPSLFGGGQETGSKTAAQYAMSRGQALQRLQTPWKVLNVWWKNVFAKVIPAFIKTMQEDEHYTKQDPFGSPLTVTIRKAELDGKIGSIELESSDQLPTTWAQKKDVILQLMQSPNQAILQALLTPENAPLLADAIGLNDFDLPYEDDRTKQYEEISQLVNSEPITGPKGEQPSVDVDMLVDHHEVEADVCRRWLISEAGRQCKIDKPKGYRNVLLHFQHHMMVIQRNQQQQQQQQQQPKPRGNVPPRKPAQDNPQQGDGNAQGNARPPAAIM